MVTGINDGGDGLKCSANYGHRMGNVKRPPMTSFGTLREKEMNPIYISKKLSHNVFVKCDVFCSLTADSNIDFTRYGCDVHEMTP